MSPFHPFEGIRERIQARREARRMRRNPQTCEDLQELKTEVQAQPRQQESVGEQHRKWEIFHQVNEGWHQYLIRDPQRVISFGFHANHKQSEFTIEPNTVHLPFDEDLQVARHTIEGRQFVVISARGPYIGAGAAVAAEGMPNQTFYLGEDVTPPTPAVPEWTDEERAQRVKTSSIRLREIIAQGTGPARMEQAKLLLEALEVVQGISDQQREEIQALRQQYESLRKQAEGSAVTEK
ncbi:MAG: hypothetical protein PHE68_04700 [Candidatus Peribacteraceae bacterium]|nr:hypothetical protein [Candidatus Peribacteraceae bacterium]MDD5075095.1 hypothetical protein [Candidatus Peribacteraceae bacterium]